MPRMTLLALSPVIAAIAAVSASAQTIDEVVGHLMEAQKGVQSFSIKMKTSENLISILGRTRTSGTYALEWVRRGDDAVSRSEQTTAMESETYGEVEKSTSKHVSVDDGEFLYSLIDKGDEFIAGKFKRDVDTTLDARKNFARMAEYKKMKVLPDEKVEGRDCYVIEELNTGEFARQEKGSISYYCKETGIRLKNVSLNLAGEEIRENVVTELRVNEPIPKERFTFQAPPGVEVNDQTKNAEEGE